VPATSTLPAVSAFISAISSQSGAWRSFICVRASSASAASAAGSTRPASSATRSAMATPSS